MDCFRVFFNFATLFVLHGATSSKLNEREMRKVDRETRPRSSPRLQARPSSAAASRLTSASSTVRTVWWFLPRFFTSSGKAIFVSSLVLLSRFLRLPCTYKLQDKCLCDTFVKCSAGRRGGLLQFELRTLMSAKCSSTGSPCHPVHINLM